MLVVIDMVDGLDDREVHKVEVVTKELNFKLNFAESADDGICIRFRCKIIQV